MPDPGSLRKSLTTKVRVGPGGRIVIPANFRQALDIKEGDNLILRLKDGELRVTTVVAWIKRSQQIVRRHVPKGTLLSDELIADRRAEAKRERSGE